MFFSITFLHEGLQVTSGIPETLRPIKNGKAYFYFYHY